MNLQAGLVGVHQLCYSNCFSVLSCFSSCCTRARCGCPKPVQSWRTPGTSLSLGFATSLEMLWHANCKQNSPCISSQMSLCPLLPSCVCRWWVKVFGSFPCPQPWWCPAQGEHEEEEQVQAAAHSPSMQWAQPSWSERRWLEAGSSGLSGILRHTAEMGTGSNLSPHSSCSGEQWLSPAWIIIVYFTKSQNVLVPTGWIVVVTTAVIRQSYKLELLPAI